MQRFLLGALLASMLVATTVAAQEPPRIVQAVDGAFWVLVGGQRFATMVELIDADALAAIPDGRAAIAPSTPVGQVIQPQASPIGQFIPGVAGQQAMGNFGGEAIRATVKEMSSASSLPAARFNFNAYQPRFPTGSYIIVLAEVEVVGTKPVCCMPGFRLLDSRGRYFSGETNRANAPVEHANAVLYPELVYQRGDYQPNLPITRVFIYDVPTDATGFKIAPDRFTQ